MNDCGKARILGLTTRRPWLEAGLPFVAGLFLVLATVVGLGAQGVPDLRGDWTCPRDEGLIRGEPIAWTLTLDIKGTYRWRVDESLGVLEHSGGEPTLSGEVRFQGVIDWDNVRVVMVDFGDTGTVNGTLASGDVLQLIGYEAGEHALVAAAICVRLAEK